MSEDAAAVVRQALDEYNGTGEPPWHLLDPEIAWTIDPPAWLAGTYHGHAGVRDMVARTNEVFEEFRLEYDELIDAGDLVVGLGGLRVRGRLSGASAFQAGGSVVRVADGKITEMRILFDREQALRAAGLERADESGPSTRS